MRSFSAALMLVVLSSIAVTAADQASAQSSVTLVKGLNEAMLATLAVPAMRAAKP